MTNPFVLFVNSRLGKTLILLAVVIGGVVFAYMEGKDSGESTVRIEQLEKTNETHRRIEDAEARGPRTPDDVDRRLRDGKF